MRLMQEYEASGCCETGNERGTGMRWRCSEKDCSEDNRVNERMTRHRFHFGGINEGRSRNVSHKREVIITSESGVGDKAVR